MKMRRLQAPPGASAIRTQQKWLVAVLFSEAQWTVLSNHARPQDTVENVRLDDIQQSGAFQLVRHYKTDLNFKTTISNSWESRWLFPFEVASCLRNERLAVQIPPNVLGQTLNKTYLHLVSAVHLSFWGKKKLFGDWLRNLKQWNALRTRYKKWQQHPARAKKDEH